MKYALLPALFAGLALTPVHASHDFDQWRPLFGWTPGDRRTTLRSPSR